MILKVYNTYYSSTDIPSMLATNRHKTGRASKLSRGNPKLRASLGARKDRISTVFVGESETAYEIHDQMAASM
ncbi:hypothetical protein C5167_050219 [Papaver somniferum]|uniref:Uncharacterized protein n=1 Tax=Papaver somniferum TaxID=3469 RepID=A0A4Y7KRF7_PAPSO|nr:hypothetical protein C5167_050219 [Papaver somniferum]